MPLKTKRRRIKKDEREGKGKKRERLEVASNGPSRPSGLRPPLQEKNRKSRGERGMDQGKGGEEVTREPLKLLDNKICPRHPWG